jgi:hypothetical protein
MARAIACPQCCRRWPMDCLYVIDATASSQRTNTRTMITPRRRCFWFADRRLRYCTGRIARRRRRWCHPRLPVDRANISIFETLMMMMMMMMMVLMMLNSIAPGDSVFGDGGAALGFSIACVNTITVTCNHYRSHHAHCHHQALGVRDEASALGHQPQTTS